MCGWPCSSLAARSFRLRCWTLCGNGLAEFFELGGDEYAVTEDYKHSN